MKLLLFSDTHQKHEELNDWFLLNQSLVNSCDCIIHCGDSVNYSELKTNHEQQLKFIKWFGNIGTNIPKLYIPGNHNISESLIADEEYTQNNIIRLINQSIEIKGYHIFGSPYSRKVHPQHAYQLDYIHKYWDIIPLETDIVVTHSLPFGILDTYKTLNALKSGGDVDLLRRINEIRPTLVVGGHLHNDTTSGIVNHGVIIKEGITYCNVSIVDNDNKVVNKPCVISLLDTSIEVEKTK